MLVAAVLMKLSYYYRIIEPLTSRCSKFRFKPLNMGTLQARLEYIIKEEGVACEEGVVGQVIEASDGDLRKAITLLQSASKMKASEPVTTQDILDIAGVSVSVGVVQVRRVSWI